MSEVNKYRITCNTENSYVYTWGTEMPAGCPNNPLHIIDHSIPIIQSVSNRKVHIVEEENGEEEPTGGKFMSQGFSIKSTSEKEKFGFSWHYPITALNIKFKTNKENVGSIIDAGVTPASFCCIVDEVSETGSNTLKVDSVNIASINLNDEINIIYNIDNYTQELGKVTDINLNTRVITFQNSLKRQAKVGYYMTKMLKIGYITQNSTVNSCILHVNAEMFNIIKKGMCLTISNGSIKQNLGKIIDVDTNLKTITIQYALDSVFNTGSYFYLCLNFLTNFLLNNSDTDHVIGDSKIGGSYVNNFYIVDITYKRIPGHISYPMEEFHWSVEYLY